LIGTSFEPVGHLPLANAATTTFLSVRTQALTVVVVSRRPVELGAAIATHAPAATTTALVDATTTVINRDLMARFMLGTFLAFGRSCESTTVPWSSGFPGSAVTGTKDSPQHRAVTIPRVRWLTNVLLAVAGVAVVASAVYVVETPGRPASQRCPGTRTPDPNINYA
jgi:hypothetical protein